MQQLVALTGKYASSLPQRARLLAVAGAVAVVGLVFAIAFYFHSETTPLFVRPLEADQLSEVTQRLSEWNIPFSATADNVSVDPGSKSDVMLRLGMFGVPHAHVATTTEALTAVNALTPQTLLDAQQRTGLEGDLALALRRISGVSDARVMIAPATSSGYVDEAEHDASASVSLTLDSGATLAPDAVSGVRSFVANSVAGLAPDHVQIIDQNGVSLASQVVGGRGESEDKPLEASLQAALDRTIGPGLTFVLAHVDVDPTTMTQHDVKRSPLGAPIADASVREHYSGKDRSYDKVRESNDRGSETIETNKRIDPGMTKRHSVAVFVDQTKIEEIPHIREVLAAGAGLDPSRGDQLVVQAFPFPHAPTTPLFRAPAPVLASVVPSLHYLPLTIVGLVALALLGRLLLLWTGSGAVENERAQYDQRLAEVSAQQEPERIFETLKDEPMHSAAVILSSLSAATTAAVLEFYDPKTRREIANRLARPMPPVLRDLDSGVQRV